MCGVLSTIEEHLHSTNSTVYVVCVCKWVCHIWILKVKILCSVMYCMCTVYILVGGALA